MTTLRRISNSEIQSFKRCRREWNLSWRLGLRPRRPSVMGALKIGERIHDALASYYVPGWGPDPRERLELLLEEDRRFLQGNNDVTTDNWKTFNSEADLQRIMLEGYVQWLAETGADEQLEVIAPEQYLEVEWQWDPATQTMIYIIGRLDVVLRVTANGELAFLDHKTTASIVASLLNLRLSSRAQFGMYRLLLHHTNREDVRFGVYSMLRKVKRSVKANPPFFHRETVEFNEHEKNAFRQQLEGVIANITHVEAYLNHHAASGNWFGGANVVAYPTEGNHCGWCPFQRMCPMMDDGSRWKDMLHAEFVTGEPLAYYGRNDLERVSTLQPGSRTLDTRPRRIEAGQDDPRVDLPDTSSSA